MQLVLSNNRVIAHGENFLAMGGVVINTETGAKYENATVAECDNCPSDIDKVGYKYHGGEFVPCAPYGTGNNNGFFMEVCESCATPRSAGIPIKGGLKLENLNLDNVRANALGGTEIVVLWENASPSSNFSGQTITLVEYEWDFLICVHSDGAEIITEETIDLSTIHNTSSTSTTLYVRELEVTSKTKIEFKSCTDVTVSTGNANGSTSGTTSHMKPFIIYGVKI